MQETCLIFIAEDNVADVTLLRIALRENGVNHDLEVFGDGASALAAILRAESPAESKPSMFIIDLNLPKVDGLTILKRVRSSTVFHLTPVIVWTTSDSPKDQVRSKELGASYHLRKPANLSAFLAIGELVKGMLHEQNHT